MYIHVGLALPTATEESQWNQRVYSELRTNITAKPMTLEQVGQIIGVTKERVRQIQNKALDKIRVQLEDNFLGVPEEEDAESDKPSELNQQAALN